VEIHLIGPRQGTIPRPSTVLSFSRPIASITGDPSASEALQDSHETTETIKEARSNIREAYPENKGWDMFIQSANVTRI